MDLFVQQNFLMNLIVLSLTHIFCNLNEPARYGRRILAAFLGAVCSTGILVAGSYYAYIVVTALVIVPLMLCISFKMQRLRHLIREVLTSWLAIVIVNGIVSVGCQWTKGGNVTWYLAILTLLAARILVKSVTGSIRRQAQLMQVVLKEHDRCVSCMGLYDSGNRLQMPDSGAAVHIIDRGLLVQLGVTEKQKRSIPYRALGTGEGSINVIQIEEMKVVSGNLSVCYKDTWMGCAQEELFDHTEYQMILNSAVRLV